MNAPALCPNCGAALPRTPSGLAGLCPACMWKDLCEPEEAAVASSRRGAGMQLPGYEIVQEIGRGGMGIVYRARQLDPSRTVALKMLLPHQLGSSEMAQRFRLEVRALSELEHPGILPVFQAGEDGGMTSLSRKFRKCGSVAAFRTEWRAGRPPFGAEGLPALLRQIAEADPVRPSTVRRRLDERAREDQRMGRAEDSAPYRGYGLTKPRESTMPRDLEVICLKCLAKEPKGRYGSARELAEDLRRWSSGRPILARPATRLEQVRAWARRNPSLAGALVLLVLVLAGAALLQRGANTRLKVALVESLLTQARLQRASRHAGQRFETIDLVNRAARYGQSLDDAKSRAMLPAFRTELAGALSLPEVRPTSRWPVQISHLENELDFSADLSKYAGPLPEGGFGLVSTKEHKLLWQTTGSTNNPAVELRLSANARWIATRFQNGDITLRSIDSDGPARTWPSEGQLPASFAFDRVEGKFAIAGASSAAPSRVEVVNLKNGVVRSLRLPGDPLSELAFDHQGARLATASTRLAVWSLAEMEQVWSVPLSHKASALVWTPDGRRIAVALDRRRAHGSESLKADPILIFDSTTGQQESLFAEAGARVERLAFHPDSKSLAAASWSGELVWGSVQPDGFRLTIEGMQRTLGFAFPRGPLAYSPSREELGLLEVVLPAVVRQWERPTTSARETFGLALSSDGHWVASGTESHIHLWDATSGLELDSLNLPASPWWLTVMFGPGDEFLYYSAFSFGVRRVALVRTNTPAGRAALRFGPQETVGQPAGYILNGYAADGRSLIVGQNRRHSQNDRIPPTMWRWVNGDPN